MKTADGYLLRVFCFGFTKKNPQASKKTAYAQTANVCCLHILCVITFRPYIQVRAIRAKMSELITKEFGTVELKDVVSKLIPDR